MTRRPDYLRNSPRGVLLLALVLTSLQFVLCVCLFVALFSRALINIPDGVQHQMRVVGAVSSCFSPASGASDRPAPTGTRRAPRLTGKALAVP